MWYNDQNRSTCSKISFDSYDKVVKMKILECVLAGTSVNFLNEIIWDHNCHSIQCQTIPMVSYDSNGIDQKEPIPKCPHVEFCNSI